MSSKRISELNQLTTAEQSDVLPIVNTGETKKITKTNLLKEVVQSITDLDTVYVPLSQRGVANGVATLDANGLLPSSQLPISAMEYKGTWNASTNSPTLVNGTGNTGDIYLVSVAGSQNLGSGSISFGTGDWCIYNGSEWQKSVNSNIVTSVNGQIGPVMLTQDNIGDGITNKQYSVTEKNKLATISANAQVNVQSDWNATSGDTFILNKPTLTAGTVTSVATGTGLTGGPIVSSGTISLSPGSIASLAKADTAIQNLAGLGITATAAQLNFTTGVTSAIQTQLNAKAPLTAPTFATSITGSYLTASQMLITDATKKIVSAPVAAYPSLTELTYLKGVTSPVQTQLNSKQVSLGFTPENVSNKDTDSTLSANSDTKYPSQKAVKKYVDDNAGGIPEAPEDGKIYGRKDATWEEVLSSLGINIGDTIGNSPDLNSVLYSNGSGKLETNTGFIYNPNSINRFNVENEWDSGKGKQRISSFDLFGAGTVPFTGLNAEYTDTGIQQFASFGTVDADAIGAFAGVHTAIFAESTDDIADVSTLFLITSDESQFVREDYTNGITNGFNIEANNTYMSSLDSGTGDFNAFMLNFLGAQYADKTGILYTLPTTKPSSTNQYMKVTNATTGELGWGTPSGGSGGGIDIGDTIGNSPINDGVLYVDGSGNLLNDTGFRRNTDETVIQTEWNTGENGTFINSNEYLYGVLPFVGAYADDTDGYNSIFGIANASAIFPAYQKAIIMNATSVITDPSETGVFILPELGNFESTNNGDEGVDLDSYTLQFSGLNKLAEFGAYSDADGYDLKFGMNNGEFKYSDNLNSFEYSFPQPSEFNSASTGYFVTVDKVNDKLEFTNIIKGTYADNATAITGGLVTDDIYKTATGEVRIVV